MDEVSAKQRDYKKIATDLFRKNYRLLLFIVAIFIAIAIVSMIIYVKPDWKGYSAIISILTSIFAGLCLSLSLENYERKKKENFDADLEHELGEINRKLSCSNEENKVFVEGSIKDICSRLDEINRSLPLLSSGILKAGLETNYKEDIDTYYRESENATSVLIHGNSFINTHKDAIVSRFNKPGAVSKWFFLNPESDYLSLVAKRTKKINSEDVKTYIIDKVNLLKEEYENSKKMGILEIYYLNNPPMQAVYIFDHTVVECKYYSSIEKGAGNHIIVYNKNNDANNIGRGFADDCTTLEKESICIFSSRYFESDKLFNAFLWKKTAFKNLVGGYNSYFPTLINSYESLSFIPVCDRGKIVLYFCYRHYQEEGLFRKNKNFYQHQYMKKAIELQKASSIHNTEAPRLFFIKGVGGTASAPKSVKILRYKHPDTFSPMPSGNTVTLKNFGYDPDRGGWKD